MQAIARSLIDPEDDTEESDALEWYSTIDMPPYFPQFAEKYPTFYTEEQHRYYKGKTLQQIKDEAESNDHEAIFFLLDENEDFYSHQLAYLPSDDNDRGGSQGDIFPISIELQKEFSHIFQDEEILATGHTEEEIWNMEYPQILLHQGICLHWSDK